MFFSEEELLRECTFKTSRSGGKGGQNVNKVSSKVLLEFDIETSMLLTDEQKERIRHKLAHRLVNERIIQVISQEDRSQLANKENALKKLTLLLVSSLKTEKPRKATKPSKAAKEKRLKDKQLNALKKINRRGDFS